jgi:hypothetical protein
MAEEFFNDEKSMHFFQLIYMLQRSSMMHMGLLPDDEGRAHFNLAETKVAIDTLAMIKEKTQGNLSDKESTMLNGIVSELQLQFVKAPARQREFEDAAAQSEAIRETFAEPRKGPSETIVDEEE